MEKLESLQCSNEETVESAIREYMINHRVGKGVSLSDFCTSLTKLDLVGCSQTLLARRFLHILAS